MLTKSQFHGDINQNLSLSQLNCLSLVHTEIKAPNQTFSRSQDQICKIDKLINLT